LESEYGHALAAGGLTNLEGDRTETVLGATASFFPAKVLPAKPDTAMVAEAAAIAMDGPVEDLMGEGGMGGLGGVAGWLAVCVCGCVIGMHAGADRSRSEAQFEEDKGSAVWPPLAGSLWVGANAGGCFG
jgi:hypothetical protein